ncbi:uncharacterized protein LOC116289913 [Actinia tenebrosa]|uniref:Uncharacterized protein LOC116289913 n=1 Tax=Actinia tenebrosa TaxID=6105 RepID=A0A6P8HC66_ACTTE|nr:uncharacterized protein LOC116289913 [Actinia tenebrosa]
MMNPTDAEIQSICDEVKSFAERESGRSFTKFEAKFYDLRGERLTGIDFYIKVYIGNGSYVHIWVYRCAPQVAQKYHQLKGIQLNKSESDPLLPWKSSLEPGDKGPWTNLSQKKDADPEVQSICDEIKADAERETKKMFIQFQAKFYYTQGDYQSGTHFFVKVNVGADSFVHIWVYRCQPMVAQKFHTLKGIQDNKTESDPLLPLPWKPQELPF